MLSRHGPAHAFGAMNPACRRMRTDVSTAPAPAPTPGSDETVPAPVRCRTYTPVSASYAGTRAYSAAYHQALKTGPSPGSPLPTSLPKTKKPTASSAHPKAVVPSSSEIKLNRLLAALPDQELKRWLPHLEPFDMIGTSYNPCI